MRVVVFVECETWCDLDVWHFGCCMALPPLENLVDRTGDEVRAMDAERVRTAPITHSDAPPSAG